MGHKAVILGNNYYIGLSAIRCLGAKGVHTVAIDYSNVERYGASSKYCHEKLIAPHYNKNKEEFIQFLINYAKKQDKQPLLLPCHDSYVEVIDQYLEELKQYYLIPQTEKGLYTEVMDKDSLFRLANKHGIKAPESVEIDDPDFHQIIKNTIKFPCLVKPVDSPQFMKKFRKKLFKVYSFEELESSINKAKNENLEVIVQRIIPGSDDHMYTFDAYLNQDAKVTHWTTCQKLRQYPINFGASVYTIQQHTPELYDLGKQFLEAIKFKGFAEIEFKKDEETGEFYLIEINARITNFNSLLNKIGLNFPYITYREMIGEPLEPFQITQNTNRAFCYLFEDLLSIKGYLKTRQLSLKEVISSYFRPKAYAIWDWKDIKPLIHFYFILVQKVLNKVF